MTHTKSSTTKTDRIRLCEAMGWTRVSEVKDLWCPPGMVWGDGRSVLVGNLPDPFTDANDDYAVLEWMRRDCVRPIQAFEFFDRPPGELLSKCKWVYQIGDYARAALKVIGSGLSPDDGEVASRIAQGQRGRKRV